ncbi:sulfotransferase domain-containing protein [Oceanicola sp. 502str15]|uniref:sulfotransferase domain-containing protein n=1 Tax=Oceanicola sp. 502str15 TaxID=2696061 RepID=UPI00209557E0|nr:hypothetical protein [Oceanicola sp. 502str15]
MIPAHEPPEKSYKSAVSDSTRWAEFVPRPGDIVVVTPPKSGTTWAQALLAMLIAGDPEVDAQTALKSPWIDSTSRPFSEVAARLDAQDHRRQVKSHTPFDGLPWWNELRYIAVFRHPLDVHLSFRNHVRNMRPEIFTRRYALDPAASFAMFLESREVEDASLHGIALHYLQARARHGRENLLLLHYADMIRDLPAALARIAAHVGITAPPALMAAIAEAATFSAMKANAARFTPAAGLGLWHSDAGFFNSGGCNTWQGKLGEAELAAYDAALSALLPPDARAWLEWGDRGQPPA